MLFGPKKYNAIGIDISESSIKILQLSKQKEGYLPSAYSHLELPNTLIANHIITDEQKLATYITRAITAAKGVNSKYVVASVPETKSFVRILKMQKMPEAEIEGAIPWELEQDIPVPIEQVYFDWQIVKEEGEFNHVLVMATPKDYVDSLISALKLANLKPVALELESQATARALIGPEDMNQASLIVDMSNTVTSMVIVSGKGVLEYTSNVTIGGNQLTESISRNLNLTPKEAEKLKLESGLLEDSKKGNSRQAMLPILDSIVEEARNVIKFHEEHSVLSPGVNRIVLTGGVANLKGMLDYITARTNVGAGKPIEHIVLGNPWINAVSPKNLEKIIVPKEEELTYSTAVGLALRGVNL